MFTMNNYYYILHTRDLVEFAPRVQKLTYFNALLLLLLLINK